MQAVPEGLPEDTVPPPSAIWHPFTQHALAGPAIFVDRAEGASLYARDGRRIIDAISSWWVNPHGHGHPRIAAAIAEQAARLDQIIFAGFTHEPAERLAEKLLAITPDAFEFVFFSDSGSTAVEVAVKMAVGYWHNLGARRSRIIALEDAYHGDTFGAMSVGHRSVFSAAYGPMLFAVDHLPFPSSGAEQRTLDALEALLRDRGEEIAAFIFEPLVLGAGGMRMYPAWVLAAMAELCRRHGVLLIADEVMTGFGRTGTLFACAQAGVVPDLLCLSKGLTGGVLPMGATLATRAIYRGFYAPDRAKMFFHSSSFTGNPIACAAALASLEIWDAEPVMERIAAIAAFHERRLSALRPHPRLADVRQTGTIAAMEIRVPEGGYLSALAPRLYDFYLENGVLLRPLGNVVYVLPPYCITATDLERIYDVIERSLDLVED
ncbi:MAG: adenosylmethionine--8-amino-7-oxononanoate transaminase [Rhodospirillales bacterium]|nr:adenosylmethionine--8-amino-7-oxononanoate transaminase [Rhodospirillales bacterium]